MVERLYGQVSQAQAPGHANPSVVVGGVAVMFMSKKKLNLSSKRPSLKGRNSLSKIAAKARETVPQEEWANVPTDLSSNIDHYLYQNKKKN